MVKLWRIARREYAFQVWRKSFLIALFSLPLLILVMVGPALVLDALDSSSSGVTVVGYVDHSGLLDNPIQPAPEDDQDQIILRAFQTEDSARLALDNGEISGFYVLQAGYPIIRKVDLVVQNAEGLSDRGARRFWAVLRTNLLVAYPSTVVNRVLDGSNIVYRTADGNREFEGNLDVNDLLPLLTCAVFIMLILTNSGYLMDAVASEKQNRTMEILITSVSPFQLMAGKILGVVAIGMTQLATWVLMGVLVVGIGGNLFDAEWLKDISIEMATLLTMLAVALPAYILVAALMVAIGASLIESEGGQVVGFFVVILLSIPMVLGIIIQDPNSAPAVVMTLIPLIALPAVGMRIIFTTIPMWQVVASVAIQSALALVAIWLAGRSLRVGMLRYGKRLRLRETTVGGGQS